MRREDVEDLGEEVEVGYDGVAQVFYRNLQSALHLIQRCVWDTYVPIFVIQRPVGVHKCYPGTR